MDLSNCIIYDITTYTNDNKGMKSAFHFCSGFPLFFFFFIIYTQIMQINLEKDQLLFYLVPILGICDK